MKALRHIEQVKSGDGIDSRSPTCFLMPLDEILSPNT